MTTNLVILDMRDLNRPRHSYLLRFDERGDTRSSIISGATVGIVVFVSLIVRPFVWTSGIVMEHDRNRASPVYSYRLALALNQINALGGKRGPKDPLDHELSRNNTRYAVRSVSEAHP